MCVSQPSSGGGEDDVHLRAAGDGSCQWAVGGRWRPGSDQTGDPSQNQPGAVQKGKLSNVSLDVSNLVVYRNDEYNVVAFYFPFAFPIHSDGATIRINAVYNLNLLLKVISFDPCFTELPLYSVSIFYQLVS